MRALGVGRYSWTSPASSIMGSGGFEIFGYPIIRFNGGTKPYARDPIFEFRYIQLRFVSLIFVGLDVVSLQLSILC
jgi:hypothetical protein